MDRFRTEVKIMQTLVSIASLTRLGPSKCHQVVWIFWGWVECVSSDGVKLN